MESKFQNFYTNISAYLEPVLKNLIAGLLESVEKWKKNEKCRFFSHATFYF